MISLASGKWYVRDGVGYAFTGSSRSYEKSKGRHEQWWYLKENMNYHDSKIGRPSG
jgi:hypothetical protein